MRQQVVSDGPYEKRIGYCRAVRVGKHAVVAGTTALGPNGVVGADDVEVQTRESLRKIAEALTACGMNGLKNTVRTRIYLRHAEDWEKVGKIHGEFFGQIQPVTSFLAGITFIHPDILIEIEADAILGGEEDGVHA